MRNEKQMEVNFCPVAMLPCCPVVLIFLFLLFAFVKANVKIRIQTAPQQQGRSAPARAHRTSKGSDNLKSSLLPLCSLEVLYSQAKVGCELRATVHMF
jgi:hypothetical protein